MLRPPPARQRGGSRASRALLSKRVHRSDTIAASQRRCGHGRVYFSTMPDEWIRQWGDPVLREVASPVRSLDDVLRAQVARMMGRLDEAEGAGLAGPQIGFLGRVFVFRASLEEEIEVMINPLVVAASAEHALFTEGCLSYRACSSMSHGRSRCASAPRPSTEPRERSRSRVIARACCSTRSIISTESSRSIAPIRRSAGVRWRYCSGMPMGPNDGWQHKHGTVSGSFLLLLGPGGRPARRTGNEQDARVQDQEPLSSEVMPLSSSLQVCSIMHVMSTRAGGECGSGRPPGSAACAAIG